MRSGWFVVCLFAAGDAGASPIVYEQGRTHSPITPEVAAHLAAIAARAPASDDRWFAKIGDSITDTSLFLSCFGGDDVVLGDHGALDETLRHFAPEAWTRRSVAAKSGWAARGPLAGTPSPLDEELAAIAPRYAVVMFGTNDVGYRSADQFGENLWTITDTLIERGVVPILSTIPARADDAEANARVPMFDLVIRAIAQGRQVPLVDYHLALAPLPDQGLARDGVHPSRSSRGACVLEGDALDEGYNVRNLVTLEALDRARRAVGGEAFDADAPARTGLGTHADPVVFAGSFADLGDTSAGENSFDTYSCGDHDERGPELVYRVDLAAPATLTANVVDRGDADLDVYILSTRSASACLDRGDHRATAAVPAGPAFVVVDTYADTTPGEFLLTVEVAADTGTAPSAEPVAQAVLGPAPPGSPDPGGAP